MLRNGPHKRVIRKQNERGITLIEMLIGAAITSLVIGLASYAFHQLQRAKKQADENLSAVGIETVGNRQLWADTRRAGVAYNLVSLLDENNRKFYDFLPDFNCLDNCERKVVVQVNNETCLSNSFLLVTTLGGLSSPTPITPISFYNVGTQNLCIGGTNSSCSNGSKIPNLILDETKFSQMLTAVDPNADKQESLVREGQLLLFYSPQSEREPGIGGLPNMNTPPRRMSFIGRVKTVGSLKKIEPVTLPDLGYVIRPGFTGVANQVDSLDKFFKWLPPVGGANAFVLIVPISVIRYRLGLAHFEGRNVFSLLREVYDPGSNSFSSARTIALPVASVEFYRPTISSASVKAKINIALERHLSLESKDSVRLEDRCYESL